ncbi:glycoside hydrolase family 43 protein [Xylariaceae sp. FL0255]|nr:glycoside hydrolase family 43 protein [Xylariaceae sp. FL0255]
MADDDTHTFQNPIITGFNPDPTICVVPAAGSTPTTCPIYSSTDLVNWRLIGHALTRRSQIEMRTVEPGAGSWASSLRYRDREKRWYLGTGVFQRYRPSSDERIFPQGFYVYTDNIWSDDAWSGPIYFENPRFDQSLCWDANDKVYLSTTMRLANRRPDSKLKDFAIHISEIDLETGRTLTPPSVIRESHSGLAEGSHILRRGEYYYLFTAEGGTKTGHQEWVFRSREGVYGPWEAQGRPLWYNGPDEEVQRTGHADVFEDGEGNWWAVLLGVRLIKSNDGRYLEPQLGQETFLVKVDWVNDWPVFNEGRNITLTTVGRSTVKQNLSCHAKGEVKWQADLRNADLELGWYQKSRGFCVYFGNYYPLDSPEAPAMLLRKQTSYTESFQCEMTFRPRKVRYEGGVVLWWSQYSYASCGVKLLDHSDGRLGPTLVLRLPSGRLNALTEPMTTGLSVFLCIDATPTEYTISFQTGPFSQAYRIAVQDLTIAPPVGSTFAGVMFGVYEFGNGEPVLDPADFTNILIKQN